MPVILTNVVVHTQRGAMMYMLSAKTDCIRSTREGKERETRVREREKEGGREREGE